MSCDKIQRLEELNAAWNEISDFKIIFYNTGSFFEIANSKHKSHDISFQSICQSLKDIRGSEEAKQFIIESAQNPQLVSSDEKVEEEKFENIDITSPVQCTEWRYFEKVVRVLGNHVLTHSRAKVAAKEQSKLFFNVISRVVHIANNHTPTDLDQTMPFTDMDIDNGIKFIEQVIPLFTPAGATPAVSSAGTTPAVPVFKAEKNTIFLGAPGTGKSYSIEQHTTGSIKIRTVFHSDTQYSDFVGSLRPRMVGTGATRTVSYEFRPGPFTNAYIQAMNHPSQPVYLIVEEINRAHAAAVFGDLFQLLDQDAAYEIDIDPDMLDYINESIAEDIAKLSMPSNLTIFATMNSSDQGVNSLDAAFKRRWAIKYQAIDYSQATQGTLSIPVLGGWCNFEWRDFAEVINESLMGIGVPEDRLLGHRFLSTGDLADKESAFDALRYKLFVYLWDDVLRHGKRQSIFAAEAAGQTIGTFGQLVAAFSVGLPIFEPSLEESLRMKGTEVKEGSIVTEVAEVAEVFEFAGVSENKKVTDEYVQSTDNN